MFPLDQVVHGDNRAMESIVRGVCGPFDLAVIEQVRRQRNEAGPLADVFMFELGEPVERHAMKIGGTPYRPAGVSWPLCKGPQTESDVGFCPEAGTPMLFLGQFCFIDSKDLVPELPSDVLLIFVEDDTFSGEIELEWYSLGQEDLVAPNDVPPGASPFLNCFGHLCRITEPETGVYRGRSFMNATKIGGSLHYQQGEPAKETLICQLHSTGPSTRVPFPWVNHPAPVTSDNYQDFDMVSGGAVYVVSEPDGTIRAEFQCT